VAISRECETTVSRFKCKNKSRLRKRTDLRKRARLREKVDAQPNQKANYCAGADRGKCTHHAPTSIATPRGPIVRCYGLPEPYSLLFRCLVINRKCIKIVRHDYFLSHGGVYGKIVETPRSMRRRSRGLSAHSRRAYSPQKSVAISNTVGIRRARRFRDA